MHLPLLFAVAALLAACALERAAPGPASAARRIRDSPRSRPRQCATSIRARSSRSRWSIRCSASASSASRSSRRRSTSSGILEEERLHGARRRRRHSHRVGGDVGIRQARHRARLRHRRHSAGVAETGRRATTMPLIAGAPGTVKGTTPDRPVNITAAIAVKKIMEREKIRGTIKIWPGVAEEQLGDQGVSRARWRVQGRRRRAVLARRQQSQTCRGARRSGSALVSVSFKFKGQSAHAAGAPWRGRSALDAVELMDVGVEVPSRASAAAAALALRDHDGGDQPNVVPPTASVWYYFRELDYPTDQGALGDRRHDRAGRGDDDRHQARIRARARLGVARTLQQADRRGR